ncbi:alpha/beta fold hydrolase [Alsobacter sp. R-9]
MSRSPDDTPAGDLPPPRRETIALRGLACHLWRWGRVGGRPLLLLHGARDCGGSFGFLVAALGGDWDIVAPDWRGHGHSGRAAGSYWMHEFVADLDVLLDTLWSGHEVDVVAHSLGGNVATLHAGLRPGRIRRLVALDAMGPPARRLPVEAAATLVDFLTRQRPRAHRGHATREEVAARLRLSNPRLSQERAAVLAEISAAPGTDGLWRWLFDPAMTRSLPTLHTLAEWQSVWSRVTAPVLWIASGDGPGDTPFYDAATVAERRALLPHAELVRVPGAGHNLHHDRPEEVAALAEAFLLR